MREIVLNEVLIPALRRLYAIDHDNIVFGVSERNICARLAFHMECIMREYDIIHKDKVFHNYHADVEYNRMGYGDIKYFMTHRHTLQYMVSDLLIQRRASGRNLLAVEMKRKGNHKNVGNDKNRLKSLVSPSDPYRDDRCVRDTILGAFIVYSKDGVCLELYENVGGYGENTEMLQFVYCERGCSLELVAD